MKETQFTDRELELIGVASREASIHPRLTINEKIFTSGLTLIAVFFIGLVLSVISWGITWVWNNILS